MQPKPRKRFKDTLAYPLILTIVVVGWWFILDRLSFNLSTTWGKVLHHYQNIPSLICYLMIWRELKRNWILPAFLGGFFASMATTFFLNFQVAHSEPLWLSTVMSLAMGISVCLPVTLVYMFIDRLPASPKERSIPSPQEF